MSAEPLSPSTPTDVVAMAVDFDYNAQGAFASITYAVGQSESQLKNQPKIHEAPLHQQCRSRWRWTTRSKVLKRLPWIRFRRFPWRPWGVHRRPMPLWVSRSVTTIHQTPHRCRRQSQIMVCMQRSLRVLFILQTLNRVCRMPYVRVVNGRWVSPAITDERGADGCRQP